MMLLAVILPAVMRGASIALAAASSARHRTEAANLAEAKLNELIVTNQWSAGQSGDFSPQHPEYHWSVQTAGSRDYGVSDVQCTVTWNEGGVQRQFVLATLAYDSNGVASAGGTP